MSKTRDAFIIEYDRLYEIMETTYNEFLDSLTPKQLSRVRCTDFGVCRTIAKRVSKSKEVHRLAALADTAHEVFQHHIKQGQDIKSESSNVVELFGARIKKVAAKKTEEFIDVMRWNKEQVERIRKEREANNKQVLRSYKLKGGK